MKLRTIHEFQMLRRIRHFLDERPELSAKPRIAELIAQLHNAIAATQTAAWYQVRGFGQTAGSTATRRERHQQLRAYLKDLARVARSLDRNTHPGLAAHFILPTTRGYDALIATARTMIKVATDLESTLIAHGLPETFLADLTTLVDDFTTATNSKFQGLQTQIAGTSGLKFHASNGVKAAQKLDAILRAHFRNDPITLGIWHHARHIQVDPKPSAKRSTDDPLPTPQSIDDPISTPSLSVPFNIYADQNASQGSAKSVTAFRSAEALPQMGTPTVFHLPAQRRPTKEGYAGGSPNRSTLKELNPCFSTPSRSTRKIPFDSRIPSSRPSPP